MRLFKSQRIVLSIWALTTTANSFWLHFLVYALCQSFETRFISANRTSLTVTWSSCWYWRWSHSFLFSRSKHLWARNTTYFLENQSYRYTTIFRFFEHSPDIVYSILSTSSDSWKSSPERCLDNTSRTDQKRPESCRRTDHLKIIVPEYIDFSLSSSRRQYSQKRTSWVEFF